MDLSKNEKKILTYVNGERYIKLLAKESLINHSNAVVVCHRLESKGLVFFRKDKNTKIVMLTEKGNEVQELLSKLKGAI